MPLLLQLMNQTFWIQNKSFSVIEAMQRGSRALAVVICQGHLIAAPFNHGLDPVVCWTIRGVGYRLLIQD